MKNKQYFLETYNDGWNKTFIFCNWILCIGITNFYISKKKYSVSIIGKYCFKYINLFCIRFRIGQILYIKEII